MRRYLTCHLVVILLCAAPVFAQARAKAQNVPEIPYESVPNFLKLPPNLYLGEAIGVATNSKGHVFVYTRSANTRLFEFDQAGAFVREIGEGNYGFEFAHAVRVDPQDNIWVVDEGTNMVIKFNPEGRVVMVLGRRPEAVAGVLATQGGPAPPAEKYLLGRPTDVAWDPQGNIFVSDGYVNHRVVKYSRDGRFIRQVGSERAGAEPSQFNTPHGIAVDAQGNVYAADAGNARIPVFDNNGTFKTEIKSVGNAQAICMTAGANQVLYVSNSNPPTDLDTGGEIYKMRLDGTMIGKFGRAGKLLKEFGTVNAIDCRSENTLYVGEVGNFRVQKLTMR
jgi:DNA-binding beta-propeller fold protein YncE